MSLSQNNPFNKPNPFKVGCYQSIQPPHIATSNTKDFQHLLYQSSLKHQYSQVSNNWSFNQNNLSKKVDFSRKYEPKISQATQFQLRMRTSSVFTLPNNQSKVIEFNEGKLQNPFHRKNLLINKEAVASQVEADLNVYRNRTTSAYQVSAGRASFGTSKVAESPILRNKPSYEPYDSENRQKDYRQVTSVAQIYMQPYHPYLYEKPSERTEKESNPQKESMPPKTLQYRRKTFYLNSPLNK